MSIGAFGELSDADRASTVGQGGKITVEKLENSSQRRRKMDWRDLTQRLETPGSLNLNRVAGMSEAANERVIGSIEHLRRDTAQLDEQARDLTQCQ